MDNLCFENSLKLVQFLEQMHLEAQLSVYVYSS